MKRYVEMPDGLHRVYHRRRGVCVGPLVKDPESVRTGHGVKIERWPLKVDPAAAVHFTVYAVRDPRDGQVVYVGQTSDFVSRKRSHLRKAASSRPDYAAGYQNIRTWMHDTVAAGVTPAFDVLEVVATLEMSLAAETRWVAWMAAAGHRLLNKWVEHKLLIHDKHLTTNLPTALRQALALQASQNRIKDKYAYALLSEPESLQPPRLRCLDRSS